jgi:hypothetical protein
VRDRISLTLRLQTADRQPVLQDLYSGFEGVLPSQISSVFAAGMEAASTRESQERVSEKILKSFRCLGKGTPRVSLGVGERKQGADDDDDA